AGQVAADVAPALALVRAREHLAGARAEVEPRDVIRVDRHRPAEDADVCVLLREAALEPAPARARVARLPDGRAALRHAAPMTGVERDDVERVAVVRMHRRCEAELGRQPFGDLCPGRSAVVAPVHADMVLLEHAAPVCPRARQLVAATPNLLVLAWPVCPQ